jgi:hypothetical protein
LRRCGTRPSRSSAASARIVFIGYGLPDDDVEVIYLFKRSLFHLRPAAITVIDFDPDDPAVDVSKHRVGQRYRTLFGDTLN